MVNALRRFLQRTVDQVTACGRRGRRWWKVAAERDAKTRFLASASHDLGQPLQAARLFFDQAMAAPDPARREAAARKVTWAFDATEQLLRQDAGPPAAGGRRGREPAGPVALGPLIARIAEMNEPAARLGGVELRAMPSRLLATADPALAERVLANLVGNAMPPRQGGRPSRVLVGARRAGDRVTLWVIDDGVGVSAADAPRLFEDFVRGQDEPRRRDPRRLWSRPGVGAADGGSDGRPGRTGAALALAGSAFWPRLPVAEA